MDGRVHAVDAVEAGSFSQSDSLPGFFVISGACVTLHSAPTAEATTNTKYLKVIALSSRYESFIIVKTVIIIRAMFCFVVCE